MIANKTLYFLALLRLVPVCPKTLRRQPDVLADLDLANEELYLSTKSKKIVSCHKTLENREGWHGACDDGLDANFLQRGNDTKALFGSFNADNQVCRVAPDATGMPKIHCIDEEELDREDEELALTGDDLDDPETHERKLAALNLTFSMGHVENLDRRRRLYDDSGANVDVLVVWTRVAECYNSDLIDLDKCKLSLQTESNMRGLIDLAVMETNVAFSLSGVRTRLRLVHAYRDDSYEEPPRDQKTYNNLLSHLTQVSDGNLDSVHVKRALYGADVVHMIAGSPGSCGLAHVGPSKVRAFSVSRVSCATGYYSFGHEITHSFGAHHDRPSLQKCDSAPDQYNFAYRDPDATFRTINAYSCRVDQCDNLPKIGCQRIQRFSNDITTYNGKKLGDSGSNNARTINEKSKEIAGYYPSMDCKSDSECNDGNAQTFDRCDVVRRICEFSLAPPADGMMEAIVVPGVSDKAWTPVAFKNTYRRPVVVCSVKYHTAGMLPTIIRMSTVGTRAFLVRLQNPRGADVENRELHCLVVEEGVWTLPDNRKVEASRLFTSRVDSSTSWVGTQRSYRHSYTTSPVVLGQVMTYQNTRWSTFWASGTNRWDVPDQNRLMVGLHVGSDPIQARNAEEIGYIVMEPRQASVSPGHIMHSSRASVSAGAYVTGSYSTRFQFPLANPPVATIVTQAGMMGGDGSWAVLTSQATRLGFGIAVDEDQLQDLERQHVNEEINYVAVSSLEPVRLTRS